MNISTLLSHAKGMQWLASHVAEACISQIKPTYKGDWMMSTYLVLSTSVNEPGQNALVNGNPAHWLVASNEIIWKKVQQSNSTTVLPSTFNSINWCRWPFSHCTIKPLTKNWLNNDQKAKINQSNWDFWAMTLSRWWSISWESFDQHPYKLMQPMI